MAENKRNMVRIRRSKQIDNKGFVPIVEELEIELKAVNPIEELNEMAIKMWDKLEK